jgi:heat shock protein HslJ
MRIWQWALGCTAALAVGLIVGTGCEMADGGKTDEEASNSDEGAEAATNDQEQAEDSATDPAKLPGQVWILASYGPHGDDSAVLAGTTITMNFESNNTVNGTGGCNDYSAAYKAKAGGSLTVWNLMSTKVQCNGPAGIMAQENKFFTQLKKATNFQFQDDGNLRIYYSSGYMILK